MSYAIYINSMRMPVNPETFDDTLDRGAKEYDILNSGKVSLPEMRGLHIYKFSSIFPAQNYSFCHSWHRPAYYIEQLQEIFDSDKPVSLTVSNGTSYGVSCKVILKSFSLQEIETGTYEYEVTLQEYKEVRVKETGLPAIQRPLPVLDQPTAADGSSMQPVSASASVYDAVTSTTKKTKSNVLPTLANKKPCKNPLTTDQQVYTTSYPPNSWQGAQELNGMSVQGTGTSAAGGALAQIAKNKNVITTGYFKSKRSS